jgi:hypothetical protein
MMTGSAPRPVERVLLHQDAFAADYREGEYKLLGMTSSVQVCVARKCA